jgi:hypothetical protein
MELHQQHASEVVVGEYTIRILLTRHQDRPDQDQVMPIQHARPDASVLRKRHYSAMEELYEENV